MTRSRVLGLLGICFGVCFATGILSYYQYHPWSWLPEPASPVWGYRVTQGIHVATGTATIPLLLVKLWSVYPNLFRRPTIRSLKHAAERFSVFILVASAIVQLATGFLNTLDWYPWPWSFVSVHRFLAYVVIGSILLHIGIKLPDIKYGLQAKLRDGDVLTELPWQENPDAHSNAGTLPPPPATALTRRGLLVTTGLGIGAVVITSIGQTVTPLQPIGALAVRQASKGPQGVPVNRTAEQAKVIAAASAADWTLTVDGPRPYTLTLDQIEQLATTQDHLPINCVEGWSVGAQWRGVSLLDIITRAGGNSDSHVHVQSLEQDAAYNNSDVKAPK